ncbi:GntR family transcriptional regulator [Puniceibacterium confluentis]|uniref:GntR family transcriptional regulator n=1 Tax=Puniceibacterium confluentis TaxID=1958944 RepID=UPI0011B7B656|nr:GntR family transcriptional regulator [Puniceibacterium confluentis]
MSENAGLGTLEPLARASVTDQVYEALHAQVLSLALPPGTKMSESEVAKQLGVSRQPVRDAFYRLSKLGFLVIQPQKATLVSKIHIQDVRRARFIRTAIEVEVMRIAAESFGPADFAALQPNLDAQKIAVAQEDRAAFHKLDDAFHQILCARSGVEFVWDAVRESKGHTDRVRFLSLASGSQRAYEDHLVIVEALRNGNSEEAVTAMRAHLGTIESIIKQLRETNHSWFLDEE